MKLRGTFLAILAVVILMGSPLAPWCQAATLIDFTDTQSLSLLFSPGGDIKATYSSWTQTVSTTNTVVGAIVSQNNPAGTGTWHAWLMNQVGSGTTVGANQIATTEFTPPYISDGYDLTSAPYTKLFTGLSLSPGTYYLVLQGPPLINNTFQGDWLGDQSQVVINTAAGFAVESYGGTPKASILDSYVPASEFITSDFIDYLFYRVETNPVPLPSAVLLLGSGLLSLAAYRRKLRKG